MENRSYSGKGLKRIRIESRAGKLAEKALMRHNPILVTKKFERINPETGAGDNQVRVDWRPGLYQPPEVYP
jgi:hypothetical protein